MAANQAAVAGLPLGDQQDFADARRGLVGGDGDVTVTDAAGRVVWRTADYAFVTGAAPDTVNPSLWRQAQLNGIHGLFEVLPGVHQVRGYDLSNLTLIDGATGWIVVDTLTSQETAAAAMALARKHLGDKPVVAVIVTHNHVDHFGGIDAVLPADPAARAAVRVVAPKGFLEEATSENVLAGVAMSRRAAYMYGLPLARDPRGHVDTGLGKAPARGTISIAEPTDLIDHTPQEIAIDGVRFVFQYAPDSEAPAELAFYLPDRRAYCGAEIVTHTLHNVYTLRGAKVRDALRWSGYIEDALARFGDAEVVFASHHWPVWGNERVRAFLASQRDMYRYIHDQTLRLANQGATPGEIAETLELPANLRTRFSSRSYYGTLRHNVRAVYQRYFGWYDGNPAHLDPLPPEEAGKRYTAAMGGAAAVLKQARAAFEAGEYRWAAMLLDHLVFAEPGNDEARALLADTYEQLGYQAESGPWRDEYLTGALELRRGVQSEPLDLAASAGLLRHLPPELFFESLGARLNGPKADGRRVVVNVTFTDLEQNWVLTVENAVLRHAQAAPAADAAATVRLTREMLVRLVTGQAGLRDLALSPDLDVDGSRMELLGFFRLFDRPDGRFAIVTP
ncbi:MAG TPA: alkyl sulfatase dimerization domain-containing protein [Candidatus Limnocylindria bacterium]|nr:alkyl sulfatase dimerization domain-containing protein [Candidatus Limnocylindria bacterium]